MGIGTAYSHGKAQKPQKVHFCTQRTPFLFDNNPAYVVNHPFEVELRNMSSSCTHEASLTVRPRLHTISLMAKGIRGRITGSISSGDEAVVADAKSMDGDDDDGDDELIARGPPQNPTNAKPAPTAQRPQRPDKQSKAQTGKGVGDDNHGSTCNWQCTVM